MELACKILIRVCV